MIFPCDNGSKGSSQHLYAIIFLATDSNYSHFLNYLFSCFWMLAFVVSGERSGVTRRPAVLFLPRVLGRTAQARHAFVFASPGVSADQHSVAGGQPKPYAPSLRQGNVRYYVVDFRSVKQRDFFF